MQPISVSGEIDLYIPSIQKTCKTFYIIYGDLKARRPLVCAHGGPGAGHAYMKSFARMTANYGIPIILYDQIGCGNSTLLPETMGDTNFWTVDLFMAELDNLVKALHIEEDFDFLGQSWGTILGCEYIITRQPKGMKHYVISNGLASGNLWREATRRLIDDLPQDIQDTIRKHEANKTYDDPEFQAASMVFYKRHVCRLAEWPQDLLRSLELLDIHNNPTVYLTMNGPSEFTMVGPLKDYSAVGRLHMIKVPTLIMNGQYDESTDSVNMPFFTDIPKVKWVTISNASHMSWLEEPDRYFSVLASFLLS
ncbi:proline-specific peptidase [Trichoderma arundinaceum]|uniref:Proline-specific peptidase n=1 Tax=Trichoderma arundinaceum TaxID=490622 RepID=A0A395P4I4_TRIAR|nr:proline-specific peptidase [Trichoderma arundinaceum]